ncbi:tRNA lysidine(34) synthetase TilS [Desulfovirgula thermocuniculi]|uniref:tRNA lysidine(34) synthetase TilS n=1 Tax=Desulfovirgula thermocuniculi TaxID=348842 RepID=UPI000423E365|nr:tRNA lysidine(34) synthetase TilS [Desulfovirgula thermocuniculi]
MDLAPRVLAFVRRQGMIAPGDRVLVAVSGGPDSVALLHLLWRLRAELGISLAVAHLNHMIRGEEARADALFVQDLARSLGLAAFVEEFDVPAFREKTRLSLQEAAREARYQFLEALARREGTSRVALGHHADDQAETVLLNFLRGAGPAGLKGIPPVRGIYIRPLLCVRRKEIEAYCRQFSLPAREDPSNKKPVYTRNRLRLELIPHLEKEYNPRLVRSLVNLAELCREENAYLEEQAARLLQEALRAAGGGALALDARALRSAPRALARRVVRQAWRRLTGAPGELSFERVEAVMGLLEEGGEGRLVELPRRVGVRRLGGELRFAAAGEEEEGVPFYRYPLAVPGATYIPEIDRTVVARLVPVGEAPPPKNLSPREALLDYDLLPPGALEVRRRCEGDRFHPLGLPGATKLKKFLINQGVPRAERDRLPLVVCGGQILWVGGVRIAEPWKVTSRTQRCLFLQLVEGKALDGAIR